MRNPFFIFFFILLSINLPAQDKSQLFEESEVTIALPDGELFGSMVIPTTGLLNSVVLFIAGSGPTDRDGNNKSGLNSNAYKLVCYAMAENGIASLRFDKWGTGKSIPDNFKDIVTKRDFESEVNDVAAWIGFLQKDQRFKQIHIIGHSQGSLIGILAAQRTNAAVSKFISISGLGKRGNETLKEQLSAQPKLVIAAAAPIIDSLAEGLPVKNVPPYLQALFNPNMQPYLISWFKYEPAAELAALHIPSLVIQGTNDIQVKEADAQYLVSKSPWASLVIIQNMNHVLRIVENEDRTQNFATYNQPDLPIPKELVEKICDFILL